MSYVDEVLVRVKEKNASEPEFLQAVEEVLGVDLPDDVIKNVIDGVKGKINVDSIKDKLGGLFGNK